MNMFCTYIYSEISKKWVVSFFDDDGMRNNRKAEFFDRELEATNRISEIMAIEGIRYVPPTIEKRIISAVHDMILEYEGWQTHTDCEEYRRDGRIAALEELLKKIKLMKEELK